VWHAALEDNIWYYRDRASVPRGPCPLTTLRTAWINGVIDENTLVWGQGLEEWVPVRNVRALPALIRTVEGTPHKPCLANRLRPAPGATLYRNPKRSVSALHGPLLSMRMSIQQDWGFVLATARVATEAVSCWLCSACSAASVARLGDALRRVQVCLLCSLSSNQQEESYLSCAHAACRRRPLT